MCSSPLSRYNCGDGRPHFLIHVSRLPAYAWRVVIPAFLVGVHQALARLPPELRGFRRLLSIFAKKLALLHHHPSSGLAPPPQFSHLWPPRSISTGLQKATKIVFSVDETSTALATPVNSCLQDRVPPHSGLGVKNLSLSRSGKAASIGPFLLRNKSSPKPWKPSCGARSVTRTASFSGWRSAMHERLQARRTGQGAKAAQSR